MTKRILMAIIFALPTAAFAQDVEGGLGDTLSQFKSVLNFFMGIAVPLALAFFFLGLIKYIKNAENKDLKKDGQKMMINSGIALFLMVGIWSVLAYAKGSIGGLGSDQLEVAPAPDIQDIIPQ